MVKYPAYLHFGDIQNAPDMGFVISNPQPGIDAVIGMARTKEAAAMMAVLGTAQGKQALRFFLTTANNTQLLEKVILFRKHSSKTLGQVPALILQATSGEKVSHDNVAKIFSSISKYLDQDGYTKEKINCYIGTKKTVEELGGPALIEV